MADDAPATFKGWAEERGRRSKDWVPDREALQRSRLIRAVAKRSLTLDNGHGNLARAAAVRAVEDERRRTDPIERAKAFIARRVPCYNAEVAGGPEGHFVIGSRVVTRDELLDYARAKGFDDAPAAASPLPLANIPAALPPIAPTCAPAPIVKPVAAPIPQPEPEPAGTPAPMEEKAMASLRPTTDQQTISVPAKGTVLEAIRDRADARDLPLGQAVISLVQDAIMADLSREQGLHGVQGEVAAPVLDSLTPEEVLANVSHISLLAELTRRLKKRVACEDYDAAIARAEEAEGKLATLRGLLG